MTMSYETTGVELSETMVNMIKSTSKSANSTLSSEDILVYCIVSIFPSGLYSRDINNIFTSVSNPSLSISTLHESLQSLISNNYLEVSHLPRGLQLYSIRRSSKKSDFMFKVDFKLIRECLTNTLRLELFKVYIYLCSIVNRHKRLGYTNPSSLDLSICSIGKDLAMSEDSVLLYLDILHAKGYLDKGRRTDSGNLIYRVLFYTS